MERSHHLTAALYFGIAALEAFLNKKMRIHLQSTKSEEEIFNTLKNERRFMTKVKKWRSILLAEPLKISDATVDLITVFNEIRGNLTHPKTRGHDIYARLETIDPIGVVNAIAEYIVRFHETGGIEVPLLVVWVELSEPARRLS